MTYNLTLVTMHDLVRVAPRRPLAAMPRLIAVPKAINAVLTTDAIKEDFPDAHADALMSAFQAGYSVSVSLFGDPRQQRPDLERMHGVDEVWLLCFRKMRQNQWRLMGRFTKIDTFVGLHLYRRSELAGKNYERSAFSFQACWDRSIGSRFLRGSHWTDYLTGSIRDVDSADPY